MFTYFPEWTYMTDEQFEIELPDAIDKSKRAVSHILGFRAKTGVMEDILQNASLKAWKNLSKFRGTCKFSSWFVQIAINEAKMLLRANSKSVLSLDSMQEKYSPGSPCGNMLRGNEDNRMTYFIEAITSKKPSPEKLVIIAERRKALIEEVLNLSPTIREEMLLYYTGLELDRNINTRK